MHHWIRPEIQALSAYHVPDPGKMIKLDAMENPYSLPEEIKDQWLELLRDVELNRYPDPAAQSLSKQLRTAMEVPTEAKVILGNGSDELIQIILMSVAEKDRVVLSVEPSFVMYKMIATYTDMEYVGVPLNDDFSLNEAALLNAIEVQEPAVVFLAYPNNPTGNLFDEGVIEKVIKTAPGLVVIDEAYHAFAEKSYMSNIMDHDNLVVMRTVSKLGLAGLRLGLLAGSEAWLNEFDKVRLPYNINVLTQATAEFALAHKDIFDQQTAEIRQERTELFKVLGRIDALEVFPSSANFILFRTPRGRADQIFAGLKEQGVLIKNLNPAGGPLQDCLRVTVGKPEENAAFLAALKSIL
jgi:histidinol-phosphate aminotransferase